MSKGMKIDSTTTHADFGQCDVRGGPSELKYIVHHVVYRVKQAAMGRENGERQGEAELLLYDSSSSYTWIDGLGRLPVQHAIQGQNARRSCRLKTTVSYCVRDWPDPFGFKLVQ